MPITYTNRKGVLYYLCRSTARAGKPPYYFAREPKEAPVEEIPAGFKIGENERGLVFLERDRPSPIRPEEVAAVEAAVRRHPQARNYRVELKHDSIVVLERTGPDEKILQSLVERIAAIRPVSPEQAQAALSGPARYAPVLRFALADPKKRTFRAERWYYSGRGGWAELGPRAARIDRLAGRLVPALGTTRFFELT